jgi:hypothetical protein
MRFRVVALASVGLVAVSLLAPATADAKAKPAPKPAVTKLSDHYSPTTGGMTFTLTGKNFTKAAKVKFGSTPAKSVKFVSKTKLTVVSPKHGAGKVDIRVTTKAGTSKVTRADKYTYVKPSDTVGYEQWTPVTDPVKGLTFQLPGSQSTGSDVTPLSGGQSNTVTWYTGDLPDWYVSSEVDVVTSSTGTPVLPTLSDEPQIFATNVRAQGARNIVVSAALPVTVGTYQGADFTMTYISKFGDHYVWFVRKIDTATARITVLTVSSDPFLTAAAASAVQNEVLGSLQIPPGI